MENGQTGSIKTVGLAPNLLSGFYGQDIISVRQFSRDNLSYIFGVADEMRAIVKRVGSSDLLKGHVLACVFYEPSTRTSSSFIAAMSRLGGSVIPINEVRYSSVTRARACRIRFAHSSRTPTSSSCAIRT
jgi:aspartate carbamoyltransferase catalytic subunit